MEVNISRRSIAICKDYLEHGVRILQTKEVDSKDKAEVTEAFEDGIKLFNDLYENITLQVEYELMKKYELKDDINK
jgi:hypothetical protein